MVIVHSSSEKSIDMSATEKPLHVDIPVTLNGVKTVYSIGAPNVRRRSAGLHFPPSAHMGSAILQAGNLLKQCRVSDDGDVLRSNLIDQATQLTQI
jgi:hypothetical protein